MGIRPSSGVASRITAHGEPSADVRPRSRGGPRRRRRSARSEIKIFMPNGRSAPSLRTGARPCGGGPMEASGVRPGPDPFLRAEIVHSSERTRVTRLFLPGRAIIRKEPMGPGAEGRVRHEAAMLELLGGDAGGAQAGEGARYPGSVVLQDAGKMSLAALARPLPVDELAGLGLGLARAVAGMHRRGVIHREITPANVGGAGDRISAPGGF